MDDDSHDDGDLKIYVGRENGASGCDGCMDWDRAEGTTDCTTDFDDRFWTVYDANENEEE